MPENSYWFVNGDTPQGPVSLTDLQSRLAACELNGQTRVCVVGGQNWVPLAEVLVSDSPLVSNNTNPRGGAVPQPPPLAKLAPVEVRDRTGAPPSRPSLRWRWLGLGQAPTECATQERWSWTNLAMVVALCASIVLWLAETGPVGLALVGVIWAAAGVRTAWTGVAPAGLGRGVYHPWRYRIMGSVVTILGIYLVAGSIGQLRKADRARSGHDAVMRTGDGNRIFYQGALAKESEALADTLKSIGYATRNTQVHLSRAAEHWVVRLYYTVEAMDRPNFEVEARRWLSLLIAARTFPDRPVEVRFYDTRDKLRLSETVPGAGRVVFGNDSEVYYRGSVRAVAERLAERLKRDVGDRSSFACILCQTDSGWEVTIPFKDLALDAQVEADFRRFAASLRRDVFDGRSTALVLVNQQFGVLKSFEDR